MDKCGKSLNRPRYHSILDGPQECKAYLRGYSTQPAETHAALVVFNTSTGKRVSGVDVARQYFEEIPDHIMEKLIQKGDVMHCCGGFMIDDGD